MFTTATLIAATSITMGQCGGSSTPSIAEVAANDGRFTTLVAAVDAAGLTKTLSSPGAYTVFAPTDAAFSKLPAGTVDTLLKPENNAMLSSILLYHVVPQDMCASSVLNQTALVTANGQRIDVQNGNDGLSIDGAKIILTNINASNGTIHVIDTVMIPTNQTIPQIASKSGNFQTLLAAAEAAGLVDSLSSQGPITIFAPTDEAFEKLPKGTVQTLLKPENQAQLASILSYHVVPGRIYSTDALKAGKAKTLQGSPAVIRQKNNAVQINDATVVTADIDASNGVIHVIDTVLLPPTKNASAEMTH